MKKILLLVLIITGFSLQSSFAQEEQDSVTLYRIETIDGNEFTGRIIRENTDSVWLSTRTVGDLSFARKNIRKMERLKGTMAQDGILWQENPQATRYFWAPNGYGLKKGEGYYQNLWVLFNQASVGLSDHFSIGVGVVPLFLFAGTSTPVWLTPKFSVPVVEDKVNVGGGALLGTVLGESDMGFGIAYGVSTFGSRDLNVTVGLGYGYAGGSWANSPMVNISGIARTGKNGYLLTENYLIDAGEETLVMLSFGGRRMIRKFGLDFGLFIPVTSELDTFVALPWLGFSVPFGNVK